MDKQKVAMELVEIAKALVGNTKTAFNNRAIFQHKVDEYDGEVLTPKDTDLEIYVWENDKFYAACFAGKSNKPLWYYHFRNESKRRDYIDKTIEQRLKRIEEKEKRRRERLDFQHDFEKGDILYSTWGYDQTNVDFYQVTDVRGKMVVIREIEQKVVGSHPPQDSVVPVKNKFIGPPKRKKVLKGYSGDQSGYVKINSFAFAYKWDGRPIYQTSLGWGH